MGAGSDYVESLDGERDIISCGSDKDWFYTEKIDDVKRDCEELLHPYNPWWETIMGESP